MAWAPLWVALICYLFFFSGREYVEIHSNTSIFANILLKTIYLSYAATFMIARMQSVQMARRRRHILMLFAGHVVVFAFIYKLRSPAIFFALMTLFLVGHSISKKVLVLSAVIAPLALSSIALARDPSLMDGMDLNQSIFSLIVTFGEFVDALRFAAEYVSSSGVLWGWGIVGSLFGLAEPLANIYAKSISEAYFDSGGGFGFFILADIYANFGLFLGVAFSMVLGYLMSKLAVAKFGSTVSFISCIVFSSALALTRNDFGSTMRGVFYCYFAFLLVQFMVKRVR